MDIEGLKEQLRRCHLRTGLEVVEEAADAIEQLQRNMRENLQREAKDYNELLAEKERIERELEEARNNAENYLYLRNTSCIKKPMTGTGVAMPMYETTESERKELDEHLRAAREKQG